MVIGQQVIGRPLAKEAFGEGCRPCKNTDGAEAGIKPKCGSGAQVEAALGPAGMAALASLEWDQDEAADAAVRVMNS